MYIKYFKNNFSDVKKILFLFLIVFVVIIILIINIISNNINERDHKNIDRKLFVIENVISLLDSNVFDFGLQSSRIDTIKNIKYYNYIYKNNSKGINDIHRLIRHLELFDLKIEHNVINKDQHIIKILSKENNLLAIIKLIADGKIISKRIKGKIAIIIDDFGYFENDITDGFINLPSRITCSVIPGHQFSKILAREIDKSNNDLFIHLPMEPLSYRGDEKQYIIMVGMNNNEIGRRINNAIDELPQAIGINNHMGSKATSDLETMNKVAKIIANKKLIFVDSYTYNKSIAYKVMKKYGVETARRDFFIDNVDDPKYISKQIDKLVQRAIKNGKAIGIGHVKKNTLLVLQQKIPEIVSMGIVLIPISEYIR